MEIKKEVTRPGELVTDIICDSCGESCLPKVKNEKGWEEQFDFSTYNGQQVYNAHSVAEFLTIKGEWGYHSKKDTERWIAHICEKCVDEKLSFIKFKITDYTKVSS